MKKKKKYYMWHLYALKLEHGRYYVGISRNPDKRFLQHTGHKRGGARFTKLFPPIKVLECRCLYTFNEDEAKKEETLLTYKYMREYGAAFVRGGPHCDRWYSAKGLRTLQEKAKKNRNTGQKVKGSITL